MEPLTNVQVAIKNNIDVFYFSCIVPMHVLFIEAGQMGRYSSLFLRQKIYYVYYKQTCCSDGVSCFDCID